MRILLALLFALNLFAVPALAAAPAASPPAVATAPSTEAAAAPNDLWRGEAIAGFIAMTLAIVIFVTRTPVLRGADPVAFPGAPTHSPPLAPLTFKRPYSLAQAQMAWWFWVVAASFTYLAILNRDIGGGLNQEALILMGIGAGTAIGSVLIDQAKTQMGAQLAKYNAAWEQLVNPHSAPPTFADPYAEMLAAAKILQSDGFLQDILSDANGISLHRFQSVAWTFVLGLIFLYSVFTVGTQMPTLTALELSLLGISAGTYLGLKIPEKTT